MSPPALAASGVEFAYPASTHHLFRDFSIVAQAGEMLAVTGASGSGKSTLLYLLGLFLRPTAGSISINGVDTQPLDDAQRSALRALEIGFVFQDAVLHDAIPIEESVAEGALYSGLSYRAALVRARDLMREFGVLEIAHRSRAEISGGQAQRAALCRALMRSPSLILADEPTGNLDSANAAVVLAGLRAAARDRGAAVIIVTHSEMVTSASDRTIRLS